MHRRNTRPLQWTRVKSMSQMQNQRLTLYDGDKDLVWDKNLKTIRKEASKNDGEFIFDPESLKKDSITFTEDEHRLSQDELRTFGMLATELRAKF